MCTRVERICQVDPDGWYAPVIGEELVRCKGCMYYSPDPWGYGLCECRDYRRVNEKDFCSWAERKEE